MKRLLLVMSILAMAGGVASAQEIRLLNAFDSRQPPTNLLVQAYADSVQKATAGKVKFRISGPDVVNAFQQLEPVAKGAFDMLFTVPPYHVVTTSVSLGIYSIAPDPAAFRASGLFDYLDKEYGRFNLKLLAIVPGSLPGHGSFHAILREPITAGDIRRRRVRGNKLYQPMIETLGASMIVMQVGDVHTALRRGTIDGAFGPVSESMDYKWGEVAKYSMRPTFGYIYHFLLIHRGSFDRLSPDVQKAIVDEAQKLEIPGQKAMDEAQKREDADLMKQGMQLTNLDAGKFAAALNAFNDGIWESAQGSRASGARAKAFHAFVKQKGFLN